jgi:3'-5' exonuclease
VRAGPACRFRPRPHLPDGGRCRDRTCDLRRVTVTFNGSSFDLPVLRYRALVHDVTAPGLSARPYFNRYTEDAVDLCDVLSSFNYQCKATLTSYAA